MRIRVFGPAVAFVVVAALAGCTNMINSAPKGNIAEKRANAVIKGFGPAHPKMICNNGDDGYGLDNQIPWYNAYFTADAGRTDDVVVAAARHAGWQLVRDEQALAVYPYLNPDGSERGGAPYQGEGPLAGVPFEKSSTYLADRRNDDRILIVDVVREGTVKLLCSTGAGYGSETSPPAGKVIIVLAMSAESTAPGPRYTGPASPPTGSASPAVAGSPS